MKTIACLFLAAASALGVAPCDTGTPHVKGNVSMVCTLVSITALREAGFDIGGSRQGEWLVVMPKSSDESVAAFEVSIRYKHDGQDLTDVGYLRNNKPGRFGYLSFWIPTLNVSDVVINIEEMRSVSASQFN